MFHVFAEEGPGLELPDMVQVRRADDEDRSEWVHSGRGDPVVQALQLLGRLHDALHDGWRAAPQLPLDQLPAYVRAAGRVASTAWSWHTRIRAVLRPNTPTLAVRELFALSWLGCMSALLLQSTFESMAQDANGVYDDWPLPVLLRADENAHVSMMARRPGRSNMVLSTEFVGSYSVRQWYHAMYALREMVHAYGWSPSLGEYYRALVLRYAMLLVRTNEPDTVYDDPRLCSRKPPRRAGGLQLPGRLNEHMVFSVERTIFFSMRQQMAAQSFWRAAAVPWTPQPRAWRHRALQACKAFVTMVASHSALRSGAMDAVREGLMGSQVMAGECEEVAFAQQLPPGQMADPDTTLYDLRRDTYMELQPLQRESVASLVARWTDACIALPEQDEPTSWEAAAAVRPGGERVAVMAIGRCLDQWLDYCKDSTKFAFVRHAFPDDTSRTPPHDAPPSNPRSALRVVAGGAPVYVAINGLYAVVVDEEAQTWITPHFVEAFARLLRTAVELRKLRAETLRATPLVDLLI